MWEQHVIMTVSRSSSAYKQPSSPVLLEPLTLCCWCCCCCCCCSYIMIAIIDGLKTDKNNTLLLLLFFSFIFGHLLWYPRPPRRVNSKCACIYPGMIYDSIYLLCLPSDNDVSFNVDHTRNVPERRNPRKEKETHVLIVSWNLQNLYLLLEVTLISTHT